MGRRCGFRALWIVWYEAACLVSSLCSLSSPPPSPSRTRISCSNLCSYLRPHLLRRLQHRTNRPSVSSRQRSGTLKIEGPTTTFELKQSSDPCCQIRSLFRPYVHEAFDGYEEKTLLWSTTSWLRKIARLDIDAADDCLALFLAREEEGGPSASPFVVAVVIECRSSSGAFGRPIASTAIEAANIHDDDDDDDCPGTRGREGGKKAFSLRRRHHHRPKAALIPA